MGSEAVHFVSARLGTSFLVWLVVGIALALPAGLRLVQVNMDEMTAEWEAMLLSGRIFSNQPTWAPQ